MPNRVSGSSLGSAAMGALLWSAAGQWSAQLLALFTYLVLARLLGSADFGLVALAGVYIAFVRIFANQGIAAAVIQREEIEPRHLDSAFALSLAVGVALAVASVACAGLVARMMGEPELRPVIGWLSLSLVVTSLSSVQVGLFKRRLMFKALAKRSLAASLSGGAVAVVMAFEGYGVWSLVAQQLVGSLVMLVLLWGQSDWRPGLKLSSRALLEILPFSTSMIGNNLVEFANRQTDKLLIGVFLGPAALGYYVVGFRIYRAVTMLMTGFVGQVAFSSFSAMQNDIPRLRASFYRATALSAMIGFPVFALIGSSAGVLLPSVLGEQWEDSVPVLQVLAFAGVVECLLFFNPSVMFALGRADWKLYVGLTNTVVNTVFLLAVVNLGIVAVAVAYSLRLALLAPLPLFLVRKLIGIDRRRLLDGVTVPVIGASILLVYAGIMIPLMPVAVGERLLALSIMGLCGLVSYALLVFAYDESLVQSVTLAVRKLRKR